MQDKRSDNIWKVKVEEEERVHRMKGEEKERDRGWKKTRMKGKRKYEMEGEKEGDKHGKMRGKRRTREIEDHCKERGEKKKGGK